MNQSSPSPAAHAAAFLTRACMLFALLVFALVPAGCGRQAPKSGGKMLVAASIAPLADFAAKVGGDLVEVELLVPPGASPHTYSLDPAQMAYLSRASVLVLNGLNLEFWADKAVGAADNPDLIVVKTAQGLPLVDTRNHDNQVGNPHVWLDPIYVVHQVKMIRDAFIKADPAHRQAYANNAHRYIRMLRHLDRDIRAEVEKFSTREFVAFHPAWIYFAHEYGLTQAAVIERSPGTEPSPAEIKNVVDTVKRLKAKAIFAEPQFSPKAAETIAAETDAEVLFLDPLGKPPEYDYVRTMRGNLQQMSKALE